MDTNGDLQLRGRLDGKALILMYHGVVKVSSDPWSLSVTPDHFHDHLEVLRKLTCPVRLQELVEGLDEKDILRRAVVITFDDGYANNLYNAKPLLERFEIPATLFLSTSYLGEKREFWWDELERLLLQPGTLPRTLQLRICGTIHEWHLGEADRYEEEFFRRHCSWRAWEDPPTPRHSLYVALRELLRPLREEDRQSTLMTLRSWAKSKPEARASHRALSLDEASELAQGPFIEIGSHTVTHPVLSSLPLAKQREEIQRSKNYLEELLCQTISSFAYPYGSECDYTADTVALLGEVGFNCACSTTPTVVTKDSNRFELPRLQVQDWDGDAFARQLSLWFDD